MFLVTPQSSIDTSRSEDLSSSATDTNLTASTTTTIATNGSSSLPPSSTETSLASPSTGLPPDGLEAVQPPTDLGNCNGFRGGDNNLQSPEGKQQDRSPSVSQEQRATNNESKTLSKYYTGRNYIV